MDELSGGGPVEPLPEKSFFGALSWVFGVG